MNRREFRSHCRRVRHHKTLICLVVLCAILTTYSQSDTCRNCLRDQCDDYGVCTYGCKPGFADKYCRHSCQSTCADNKCEVQKDTGKIACVTGCVDGYCGWQCKVPCPTECSKCDIASCTCPWCEASLYGDSCQHSCSETCGGSVCDNTGQCWHTCRDGLYGINCDHKCGSHCVRCTQESGQCLECNHGFHGIYCKPDSKQETNQTNESSTTKCEKGNDGWLIPLCITGWTVAIISTGIIFWLRRKKVPKYLQWSKPESSNFQLRTDPGRANDQFGTGPGRANDP